MTTLLIIFGTHWVGATEQSSILSLIYLEEKKKKKKEGSISYGIDYRIQTIVFNSFSSSEQHFGIRYQIILIQEKKDHPPTEDSAYLRSTMFVLLHCLHKLIWTKDRWVTSSPISTMLLTSNHLSCHLWMLKDGKLPTVVADWEQSSGSRNFCWFCTWEPTGTPERRQIGLWRMATGSNAWMFITFKACHWHLASESIRMTDN